MNLFCQLLGVDGRGRWKMEEWKNPKLSFRSVVVVAAVAAAAAGDVISGSSRGNA